MSPRPSTLPKFLQTLRQPLFLLDGDATMLFCNRALEDWTGCEAKLLLGQQLRYQAAASRQKHEIVAAALAPPPEVFQGRRCCGVIAIDRITSFSRRKADFLPLQPAGVLVLIDESDVRPGDEQADGPESLQRRLAAELHQTLLAFRRRQAGRFQWDRMIGSSPRMQRVRRLARLSADTPASVLILGEEGTGNEHLAAAMHYGAVGESVGALLPIECSVLDPDLITATVQAFRKRFQQEKGPRRHTLLLKDADRLPDAFVSVVSEFLTAATPNLRLVSTATRPPTDWPGSDLLSILLGTILIDLPPLRQRREDIPLLAQMFLEQRNHQADRQRAGFTSDALDLLVAYDWPGNLQELELAVDHAHGHGPSSLVALSDLPDRLHNVFQAAAAADPDDRPIDLDAFLEKIERELIERALQRARGNKSLAAELLGLTRPRLYRRLEFFGLVTPEPDE